MGKKGAFSFRLSLSWGFVYNIRMYLRSVSYLALGMLAAWLFAGTARALDITPGAAKDYVAGVFPDGDNDATWEDRLETSDFQFTFNNGAQTPVAVNDPAVYGITQTYVFPAARATAPAGNILAATLGASFEIWFRPDDLTGNHILFECGGQGSGTSFILEGSQLHFIAQSGAAEKGAA